MAKKTTKKPTIRARKVTSKQIAKIASSQLRSKRATKKTKKVAGSALSQREKKK